MFVVYFYQVATKEDCKFGNKKFFNGFLVFCFVLGFFCDNHCSYFFVMLFCT